MSVLLDRALLLALHACPCPVGLRSNLCPAVPTPSCPSYTVLFAFEEAIGFMLGQVEHDKDGISAAAVFAELAGVFAGLAGRGTRSPVCLHPLNVCRRSDLARRTERAQK